MAESAAVNGKERGWPALVPVRDRMAPSQWHDRQRNLERNTLGGHWTRTATGANRDSNGKDRRRTEFAVGEKVAECTRRTRLHTLADTNRGPQWRTVVKPWQRHWKRKVARSEVRTWLWRASLRAAHRRTSLTSNLGAVEANKEPLGAGAEKKRQKCGGETAK